MALELMRGALKGMAGLVEFSPPFNCGPVKQASTGCNQPLYLEGNQVWVEKRILKPLGPDYNRRIVCRRRIGCFGKNE